MTVLDKILKLLESMTDDEIVKATSYSSEDDNGTASNDRVIQDILKSKRDKHNSKSTQKDFERKDLSLKYSEFW